MATQRLFPAIPFALLLLAGCGDGVHVTPAALTAPATSALTKGAFDEYPSGEKLSVNAVVNPIYDWDVGDAGPLVYGSRPTGPARWPAHPNINGIGALYVVVYPIGTTVTRLQCYDYPSENCPDHGPSIAAGAAGAIPWVYGAGVLGHDHLGPNHGSGNGATDYAVVILFTSSASANMHLTTRAQVDAAVASGAAVKVEALAFSFHNSPVNGIIYEKAAPWICPAYTTC